jgi:curli biogenesis system outer membrane secretion channel CsgG
MNRLALAGALGLGLLCGACGYGISGRASTLPANVKTIAIPAFANATTRSRLAERLPADITREFISRTRYRVVADPAAADAVLTGAVSKVISYTTTLDPTTSRASSAQVTVNLSVTLTDRATGKVIYSRNFDARERYEVSANKQAYFDESDAALDRLSRGVARTVVSGILENF